MCSFFICQKRGGRMIKKDSLLMKETENHELIVTSEVLTRIFDVTPKAISTWSQQGCPKYNRGWWNLKDVIEWRGLGKAKGEKKSDEAKKLQADAELKTAKARQEELKLAEMMGELIPVELVEAQLSQTFSTIRQRLLALPNEIRTEAYTLYPEYSTEVTRIADKTVRECLDDLATHGQSRVDGKVARTVNKGGRPRKFKVQSTAEADSKPMG